jgi:hypothetical protein
MHGAKVPLQGIKEPADVGLIGMVALDSVIESFFLLASRVLARLCSIRATAALL